MSDALGIFFNQLMTVSGNEAKHISVISDNAKRMDSNLLNRRRRRAPRRSVSTPLNHMSRLSRWDPPSRFDFDSYNGHSGDSTMPSSSSKKEAMNCRWESMSDKKKSSDGLIRPKRQSSSDDEKQVKSSKKGKGGGKRKGSDSRPPQKSASFSVRGRNEMTSTSLPKSLRSLPY